MALKDDLNSEVTKIFSSAWTENPGRVVPVPSDVGMGNVARHLENAVVLYADLDGSTSMVDTKKWQFSSEIYKTFLHCAAKICKDEGADITAYDGDRIMAIFVGENKCDRAVKAGMKIKWAIKNIITPAMKSKYNTDFEVAHTVGIDMSDLRAVRTGVRGDNDLVWVGRAANYAAKLTTLPSNYPTYITKNVYNELSNNSKLTNGKSMWESIYWPGTQNIVIYRSNWMWSIS